jgi:2-polyprenyl-3-methyl-5-hydroxy-6-metoxy-1,4-benzoquinol methylase
LVNAGFVHLSISFTNRPTPCDWDTDESEREWFFHWTAIEPCDSLVHPHSSASQHPEYKVASLEQKGTSMNQVEQYYDQNALDEWQRLERHRTEFAVTMLTLEESLPPPPARIADIGGGPGRYSIALAEKGYQVTLVDLAQENLAVARDKSRQAGVGLDAVIQSNALDLSDLASSTYHAVLLFGPLYHLLTKEERLQAVREALRILEPGGLLAAAFITRFAQFRWAARNDPLWLPRDREYTEQFVEKGTHRVPGLFTDAHFAHPAEVVPLMESAGLTTVRLQGCEGAVSHLDEGINQLEGEDWDYWVQLNYRIGQEPSMYGASDHLLYLGRKGG